MIAIVKHCHAQLRETRGVVMSLAVINELEGDLTWMGIGNVGGVVVRAATSASPRQEYLLLRGEAWWVTNSVAVAFILTSMRGDTLILVTDGIRSNSADVVNVSDPPQVIADRILAEYSKGLDDALVVVARYLK